MSSDLSLLHLILEASLVVQLVMLILLAASLMSWSIIFQKRHVLRRARNISDKFEESFWSGSDLSSMFKRLQGQGGARGAMESIFEAGFREFARLRGEQALAADLVLESSRRAMLVAQTKEVDRLEQSLATLATVGSTSPYIGLFGTVWGIMNSFIDLGSQQQVTIATVAPGIAEALIATAMGLFAAIPAVIAYNRFAHAAEKLTTRYEVFMEEFVSIVNRQLTIEKSN